MTIKLTFSYNSFNLEKFSTAMSSLNLKSGVPYFIYLSSSSGKRLSDIMPFIIPAKNIGDPFDYITYSGKDSMDKCIKSIYKRIDSVVRSLEPSHPSIKISFSLSIVTNFIK